ncbi:MAG: hypothetical protein K6C69_00920 [Lachnospiraceae bacterium]|nr:hypothetical protein [Lachnospiraceae bacterium]
MNQDTVNMTVSPICRGPRGDKYAFVNFEDGNRVAEGKIPDCKILSSSGFTPEEVSRLESYMEENLGILKKMAAGIHVLDAFMK